MRKISLILMLFCFTFAGMAQEASPEWEAVVFAPSPEPTIYKINADGSVISTIIPSPDSWYGYDVQFSPSKRYILYSIKEDVYIAGASLYDTQTETYTELLTRDVDEEFAGYQSFTFNAGETQILANYSIYTSHTEGYGSTVADRELIYDIATGTIEFLPEDSNLFAEWSNEAAYTNNIVTIGGNSPIPFLEVEGTIRLPNSEERITRTMVITPYGGLHDAGDTLINGEHIVSSFIANLDRNGLETSVYSSMILYQPSEEILYPIWVDRTTCDVEGTFCYTLDHPFTAHWVMDGNFVYVHPYNFMLNPQYNMLMLLARDGDLSFFELPGDYQFLAGTPDGWLMFRFREAPNISHFTLQDGELVETILLELPQYTETLELIEKPVLGASLENSSAFPEVQQPYLHEQG